MMIPYSVAQRGYSTLKRSHERSLMSANKSKERTANMIATATTAAEVSFTSFLFGCAQGKFGGVAMWGIPVDLVSGLGLHILGFTGVAGAKYGHHLHALADGALASYMNGLGRSVGRSFQTDTDRANIAAAAATVSGDISGITGGASLADEELARMVRAGR